MPTRAWDHAYYQQWLSTSLNTKMEFYRVLKKNLDNLGIGMPIWDWSVMLKKCIILSLEIHEALEKNETPADAVNIKLHHDAYAHFELEILSAPRVYVRTRWRCDQAAAVDAVAAVCPNASTARIPSSGDPDPLCKKKVQFQSKLGDDKCSDWSEQCFIIHSKQVRLSKFVSIIKKEDPQVLRFSATQKKKFEIVLSSKFNCGIFEIHFKMSLF